MTADPAPRLETEWLTLPELVETLGEPLGRVRRLLDEQQLIGSRRDGSLKVPALFIVDGHPLSSLRGTAIVLHDAGFTDDEAIDWLLTSRGLARPRADRVAARRAQERSPPRRPGARLS